MRVINIHESFIPPASSMRTGNLFNEKDKRYMISRIIALSPDQKPVWGRMSLSEMLDHCALALESALDSGIERVSKERCAELEYVSKLWYCDPRLSFSPDTELKMTVLINFVKYFKPEHMARGAYPFLGETIFKEFGEIHFLHLDHHLTQFGK